MSMFGLTISHNFIPGGNIIQVDIMMKGTKKHVDLLQLINIKIYIEGFV